MTDTLYLTGMVLGVGGMIMGQQAGVFGETASTVFGLTFLALGALALICSIGPDVRRLVSSRGEPT